MKTVINLLKLIVVFSRFYVTGCYVAQENVQKQIRRNPQRLATIGGGGIVFFGCYNANREFRLRWYCEKNAYDCRSISIVLAVLQETV